MTCKSIDDLFNEDIAEMLNDPDVTEEYKQYLLECKNSADDETKRRILLDISDYHKIKSSLSIRDKLVSLKDEVYLKALEKELSALKK